MDYTASLALASLLFLTLRFLVRLRLRFLVRFGAVGGGGDDGWGGRGRSFVLLRVRVGV